MTTTNTSQLAKATFRDYLSQPVFAEELEYFAMAGEMPGIFSFYDLESFFESMHFDGRWESDKCAVEDLANFLEFYAKYFRDLCAFAPDRPVTLYRLVDQAKKIGRLELLKQVVRDMECVVKDRKSYLDRTAF